VYSRVTLVEVDTVRADVHGALALFQSEVLPELRREPGFCGVMVMATPEGKGLLMSLWETAEAADASREDGFYAATLRKHALIFRAPPGREHYELLLADVPALAAP
jgi:heme-degrading monooxygenase HmoA